MNSNNTKKNTVKNSSKNSVNDTINEWSNWVNENVNSLNDMWKNDKQNISTAAPVTGGKRNTRKDRKSQKKRNSSRRNLFGGFSLF